MNDEYDYEERFNSEQFALEMERDARRYNKAYTEEEEVRLL